MKGGLGVPGVGTGVVNARGNGSKDSQVVGTTLTKNKVDLARGCGVPVKSEGVAHVYDLAKSRGGESIVGSEDDGGNRGQSSKDGLELHFVYMN